MEKESPTRYGTPQLNLRCVTFALCVSTLNIPTLLKERGAYALSREMREEIGVRSSIITDLDISVSYQTTDKRTLRPRYTYHIHLCVVRGVKLSEVYNRDNSHYEFGFLSLEQLSCHPDLLRANYLLLSQWLKERR